MNYRSYFCNYINANIYDGLDLATSTTPGYSLIFDVTTTPNSFGAKVAHCF
jgi:hypothetical protein